MTTKITRRRSRRGSLKTCSNHSKICSRDDKFINFHARFPLLSRLAAAIATFAVVFLAATVPTDSHYSVVAVAAASSAPTPSRHFKQEKQYENAGRIHEDDNSIKSHGISSDDRDKKSKSGKADSSLTLGDLDSISSFTTTPATTTATTTAAESASTGFYSPMGVQNFDPNNDFHDKQQHRRSMTTSSSSEDISPSKSSLRRRVTLDLSGRVFCHLFSTTGQRSGEHLSGNNMGDTMMEEENNSIPLFYLPNPSNSSPEKQYSTQQQQRQQQRQIIPFPKPRKMRTIRKIIGNALIPQHLYVGANYDLDEVWYGVTRWILRSSWRTAVTFPFRLPSSMARPSPSSIPSSSSSSSLIWNLEGEQSVFDRHDSTLRLELIHRPSSIALTNNANESELCSLVNDDDGDEKAYNPQIKNRQNNEPSHPSRRQQLTVEYDSPNYQRSHHTDLDLHQAPTLSTKIQTQLFHPRLEIHSKSTWILGSNFDSELTAIPRNGVQNRLEDIKSRYRENIPRSSSLPSSSFGIDSNDDDNNNRDSTTTSTTSTDIMQTPFSSSGRRKARLWQMTRKFNHWVANDGWMPRKLSANLAGDFVSVSEIGFSNRFSRSDDVDYGANDNNSSDDNKNNKLEITHIGTYNQRINNRRSRRKWNEAISAALPPLQNAGIRLRISKKIDWNALGVVFPWNGSGTSSSSSSKGGIFDPSKTTRIQLQICGLYESEESWSWIGVDADPMNLAGSWKVVVGRESVNVWGEGKRR
mmetsp:Transcript_4048/g.9268  ORF Transcript_4048/g.9268 Transcript_4048/m.9268 type:complete len:752 (+) Transcript_4048:180-2435(+)